LEVRSGCEEPHREFASRGRHSSGGDSGSELRSGESLKCWLEGWWGWRCRPLEERVKVGDDAIKVEPESKVVEVEVSIM